MLSLTAKGTKFPQRSQSLAGPLSTSVILSFSNFQINDYPVGSYTKVVEECKF